MIGDKDPEDAFDADDPPDTQLSVLERVVDDLLAFPDEPRRGDRREDALRIVTYLRQRPRVDQERLHLIRRALEEM